MYPRSKLLSEIRKLPQKPTLNQQLKVTRMRNRLSKQIKDFLYSSNIFLPNLEEADLKAFEEEHIDTPADEFVEPEDVVDGLLDEEMCYDEEDEDGGPSEPPETIIIPLPSNVTSTKLRPHLETLISMERELRKGQANDALEGLRIGLANKSILLQNDVNHSQSTKQSTRAWASVRNTQTQILQHAQAYQRAWRALESIGTPEDLVTYQKLEQKDLVVVKDISKAKRFGQGSDCLAWFWQIGPSKDLLTGKWMEECELILTCFKCHIFKLTYLVYRVNWLRAKARVDRWQEEQILVKNEMRWTTLWFQNQANIWRERSEREDDILPIGHKSYATKQQKLWSAFERKSAERFGIHLGP
jgi:hypothetical protein